MAESSKFSLTSLIRSLGQLISGGRQTPGGWIGPRSAISSPQLLLAALRGKEITETGQVRTPEPFLRAQTPQFTGATQAFLYPQSTILTPTPAATPPATSKTTTTTSTKAPGAVAPTPATQTTRATVATPSPAPTPTATPPTPTTSTAAKTGVVTTPPPSSGYMAPLPAALPPTPVMPGEVTQPTTPENLARFEAMIRALQELAGGARYVPMPAIGAEPFGPAGALERALRRLREREVRV